MDSLIRAFLTHIAQAAIADKLASSAGQVTAAAVGAMIATKVVALLAVASIGCAMAALWMGIAPLLGAIWATVVIAALLAVLFIGGAIRLRYVVGAGFSSQQPVASDAVAATARLFQDHKGSVLMAALIAGLAAGRSNKG